MHRQFIAKIAAALMIVMTALGAMPVTPAFAADCANTSATQYRSANTGNWNAPATWECSDDGINWQVPTTNTPTNANSFITIRNTHNVTVSANVTADQLTIDAGGQVTVNTGITWTLNNGTGATDVTINGTIENSGTMADIGNAVLVFNSGSIYRHAQNGGVIPSSVDFAPVTWNTASTVEITGITSTAPSGLAQSFGNFTWNSTSQGATTISLGGNLTTINGNFTVNSTGIGATRINGGATDITVNIGGNYTQTAGTLIFSSGTGDVTFNVGGNFSVSGGVFNMSNNDAAVGTVNLTGNFTHTSGTIREIALNTGTFNFLTGTHSFTSGGTVTGDINFVVNNGATLNMGTSTMSGNIFTLSNGGTLGIGSTNGITTAPTASGNIQTTTRTYNTGANYTYNGTASQAAGNGLPTTVNNLTIDNTGGAGNNTVSLSTSHTVNGVLTFTNGNISTGANSIILPVAATVSGAGAGKYVNGNVQRAFTAGSPTFTFPIGDGSNYAPVDLTFTGITTGGDVTASTTASDCAGSSGIDTTKSANHCWTLTNSGTVFTSYSPTFNFAGVGTDADAGANTANFIVRRFSGGTWSATTNGTRTATSTQATGVTAMSDFAVGESSLANTTTTVNCATNPVTVFSGTVCTATVTRASGANTPSGTITWGTDGAGAFTAANTCVLAATATPGVSDCSVTYTPSAVGTGSHTITASYGGDSNFNSSNGNQVVTVNKATPTITFGAAPTPTYLGGNFTVSANTTNTDSSTLTYSYVSGPCAFVSGADFSSSGAGTCVVQANGAATANFNAASQTQNIAIAKATPTITFGAAPTPTYLGGNFTVSANTTNTDSSTITYSYVSGPCAFVSGATFSSSGAGNCMVQADGAATTNFNAASQTQSITIAKATPTINFGAAPTPTFPGGNFTVSANTTNTDSSTLTYSYVSGPCTFVSGADFSPTGTGTCVVQANGAATTNFNAASQTQNVLISAPGATTPTITFDPAPNPTYLGGNFTVNATTTNTDSSTLTYSYVSGPCAFVSGATFSSSGAGTCVVRADGAATANFTAASAIQNVTIAKANPTLSISNPTVTFTGAPQTANVFGSVAGTVSNVLYNGSATAPTNVGTYAVTADFAPTDATNFNSLAGASAGNFTIQPAGSGVDYPTFLDVPTDYWAWQYIEAIYAAGITSGCGNGNYCPTNNVTRAQMAIFLLRGIHGSYYTPPAATGTVFADVPADYWAASWVEQLALEGITGGCGNGNYCPDAPITRAEMSIFLLRAKYGSAYVPPTATGTLFIDVPADYWAVDWVEQLYNEGVARGCGNGNFCPDIQMTRDQMAVFLQKLFGFPLP